MEKETHTAASAASVNSRSSTLRNSLAPDDDSFWDQMKRLSSNTVDCSDSIKKKLATNSPRNSVNVGLNPNSVESTHGEEVNPTSPYFDAEKWTSAFVESLKNDPENAPRRFLGVAFQRFTVRGRGNGAESHTTVANAPFKLATSIARFFKDRKARNDTGVTILNNFEGVVKHGELLLVLGPPGSGCSTLLKALSGHDPHLEIMEGSLLNYRGIDTNQVRNPFRGDVLYNAEVEAHLPHLTVGETLTFATRCRSPRHVPGGLTREQADTMIRDVTMATFGITHTFDTPVGNEVVRGVSGGERKRVSIAEASLTGAKFQCWDNTTRGLDSTNAINFCESLRIQANQMGVAAAVALYQAPQAAYDTVPDFLTSMTSKAERHPKKGCEHTVPKSPEEFAEKWMGSAARARLDKEIKEYDAEHPAPERRQAYSESRRREQAKGVGEESPFTITYRQQVRLALWRGYRRLLADPGFTIASLLFNVVIAVLLGSIFFNLKEDTSTFYYRGGLIFFSLLFNAFASQLEVLTVYDERPVIEKHNRYAFYHQSAQAIASYLTDLPYKTVNMFIFNLLIYFMANLRRDAGHFLFFCLTTFLTTLVASCLYRILACVTRTPAQAMVPSSLLSLGLMIYTGFTIPVNYLPEWGRILYHINPLAYAFESLMANEFHGRQFPCAVVLPYGPGYDESTASMSPSSRVCSSVAAEPNSTFVDGDRYIKLTFNYEHSRKWPNVFALALSLFICFFVYITAAEYAKPHRRSGEVLILKKDNLYFSRAFSSIRKYFRDLLRIDNNNNNDNDVEAQCGGDSGDDPEFTEVNLFDEDKRPAATGQGNYKSDSDSIFHWQDLCYDISVEGTKRRILSDVDGWVKPGTSTALMGVSGAGKTTLLDVLATRFTTGVVSGHTLINGLPTDSSFQHRVGYVQQQDLHLETMTVREALEFSALLRQSAEVPRHEKLAYVDEVIKMLEMGHIAHAIIGVPGQGLNVEQRKRLTIGIELAARPQLLLFLDEPTSGLDSQTSWAIIGLINKLKSRGQAVLCTIHQPSTRLFNEFDRLLLLAPGGQTVYFGDLGENSSTMIDYFERNGADKCPPDANQAEWMLDVIKPNKDNRTADWPTVWRTSAEYKAVRKELDRLCALASHYAPMPLSHGSEPSQHHEFVASYATQMSLVLARTWKHFWRSPTYVWSKLALAFASALFIGVSFKASNTLQGLQNQLYAIVMFLVMFGSLSEQIMPMFIPQRSLYEMRERPSKIYRWHTWILANVLVEAVWNTAAAFLIYIFWYYPVGFVINTTAYDAAVRGFTVFLFLWMFMLFTGTFSHFAVTWIPSAEIGGVVANLLWMCCLVFCGVAVVRADFPAFLEWMYHASPGTYLVGGIMSAAISGSVIECSQTELLHLEPPANATCGQYLGPFAEATGGNILNPNATNDCSYCPMTTTDQFLAHFDIDYGTRWRDFGMLWVYIVFNIVGALAMYWLVRVKKAKGVKLPPQKARVDGD